MESLKNCIYNCKFYNSATDDYGNTIYENEELDFNSINGEVDCDKAKNYIKINSGKIKHCPGFVAL